MMTGVFHVARAATATVTKNVRAADVADATAAAQQLSSLIHRVLNPRPVPIRARRVAARPTIQTLRVPVVVHRAVPTTRPRVRKAAHRTILATGLFEALF